MKGVVHQRTGKGCHHVWIRLAHRHYHYLHACLQAQHTQMGFYTMPLPLFALRVASLQSLFVYLPLSVWLSLSEDHADSEACAGSGNHDETRVCIDDHGDGEDP